MVRIEPTWPAERRHRTSRLAARRRVRPGNKSESDELDEKVIRAHRKDRRHADHVVHAQRKFTINE